MHNSDIAQIFAELPPDLTKIGTSLEIKLVDKRIVLGTTKNHAKFDKIAAFGGLIMVWFFFAGMLSWYPPLFNWISNSCLCIFLISGYIISLKRGGYSPKIILEIDGEKSCIVVHDYDIQGKTKTVSLADIAYFEGEVIDTSTDSTDGFVYVVTRTGEKIALTFNLHNDKRLVTKLRKILEIICDRPPTLARNPPEVFAHPANLKNTF